MFEEYGEDVSESAEFYHENSGYVLTPKTSAFYKSKDYKRLKFNKEKRDTRNGSDANFANT